MKLAGRRRFAHRLLRIRDGALEKALRAPVALAALWRRDAHLMRERVAAAERMAAPAIGHGWEAAKPKVSRAWHATKPRIVHLEHDLVGAAKALGHKLHLPRPVSSVLHL